MYQNPFTQADIAANTPQPQVVQIQAVPPGLNPAPNIITGVDPALAGPINPATVNDPKPGDTPVLDVDKLWQTPLNADGTPVVPAKPGTFLPEIPADKLTQMFGGLEFSKNLPVDQLNAIAAGGEGAVAAIKSLLDNVGRQVAMVNFKANTGMIERGLGTAKERFLADVPGLTTEILADNALAATNPLMANPKYAPMVTNVRAQLQTQYPRATAVQIEGGVKKYFDDMAKDMGATLAPPKQPQNQSVSGKRIMQDGVNADWENWGST